MEVVRFKNIHISEISIPSFNIHETNRDIYQKMKYQISKNGQLYPILVRKIEESVYEIIDGAQRFKIFKELEYENVICSIIEECNDLKAMKLAVELNLLSFEWDIVDTSKVLSKLSEKYTPVTLEKTIDFEEKYIRKYIDLQNWEWDIFHQNSIPEEFKPTHMKKIKSLF